MIFNGLLKLEFRNFEEINLALEFSIVNAN